MMENIILREGEYIDDLQSDGYRIIQRRDIFRFGTDTVLLADFANPKKHDIAVDLGCGTGAIALLMLSHQPTIKVTGIEIQEDIFEIAQRNVLLNDASDSFDVINCDMRTAHEMLGYGKYTLAVCNPPYFKNGAALLSESENKRIARHEGDITPEEIARSAYKLIKNGGRLDMIYPADRMLELMRALEDNDLAPKRVRTVHGRSGRAPKHILIEAVKGANPGLMWLPPLELMDANGEYTPEWHRIYDTQEKNT